MESWGILRRNSSFLVLPFRAPAARHSSFCAAATAASRLRSTTLLYTPLPRASSRSYTRTRPENTPHFKRREDPTTMTTTVELATVPTADTPGTCIYVHHEKRSYVFGQVAEGTQRAFASRKLHLGGTEHVFLSGPVGWSQMGGLIGYLLSVGGALDSAKDYRAVENSKRAEKGQKLLRQVQHSGVTVHGADNLCHMLASVRPVIFRQPVAVSAMELREDPRGADASLTNPDWEDESVRVWKVPVRRARSSSPTKRRYSEDGDQNSHKPASQPSDPFVAGLVMERVMFNGSHDKAVLVPKKLNELTPEDDAIIIDGNSMRRYTGPYGADALSANSKDAKAWVFPDLNTVPKLEDDGIAAIKSCALPRTAYSETSLSYIMKCHDRRGKFNAQAAKELGVKPQNFKLLTAGETATSESGKVVTPEMVLGERQPGKGIAVADISSRDFLDAFFERPEWTNAEIMANITSMYWILGDGLASDPKIQQYIKAHPAIKHVFCSRNTCPNMVSNTSSGEMLAKLRRIDPERFPPVVFDNTVQFDTPEDTASSTTLGRAGDKIQIMPRILGMDDAIAPFTDLEIAYKSVDDETLALAEKAKAKATDPAFLARIERQEADIPSRDAEIIPLGTGSSMPSKHRNVSSTLLRVPGVGNYLLDCGEGTLGQIQRSFGAEETAAVLRDLRCLVISHLHADHHMGVTTTIKAWYEQALADKSDALLAVVCIGRYRTVLEEMSQVEDIGFHRLRFPSCPDPASRDPDVTSAADLAALGAPDSFGLKGVKRIPVSHCWRSYGTELELASGLRVAWSGDCRPSSKFAQACRGAHLLVHECTFGDDMRDHARHKMHSTMGEALGVAKEMGARRTLLTHFSQRYTKADALQKVDDEAAGVDEDKEEAVLFAHDLMRVKLGDFQKAACYIPAVELLMAKMADA